MPRKKTGRLPGGQPWEPTPEQIATISKAAMQGATIANAARLVRIHPATLSKNAKARAAYEAGKEVAISKVAGKLIQTALGGNVTAMIFYLKTQGGWIDRQHHEVNRTSTSQVNIDVRALLEGKSEKEIAEIERSVRTLLAAGLVDQLDGPASDPEGMRGSPTQH